MNTRLSTCLLALAFANNAAHAQSPLEAIRSAGERIALHGADNGIAACSGCHGALGEGSAAGGFPRIAGMSERYLAHQLRSYANGKRTNPVMGPIARRLGPEQIADISAYYAGLSAPPSASTVKADAALMERGRTLALSGDRDKQVQACVNCHGPAGTGEPPGFPYLAGQHAAYLSASLLQWKEGGRDTDGSRQMVEIASRLDARDRSALAAWFAAQMPPAPAGARVNVPVGSARRPVGPGASSGAEPAATKGLGSEQGAPTTGGNVGPGAGGGGATGNDRSGGR